jgi:hypothetical protein
MVGINNSLLFNPCYEVEGTAGTDPATTRIAWPGAIEIFEPKVTYGKVTYYGPSSILPLGRYGVTMLTEFHVEYVPFDEFTSGNNSRVALMLGSAPNASTGVITVGAPRTQTIQFGIDLATDVYYRARYGITRRMEITVEKEKPVRIAEDIVAISKWSGTDTQATAFAANPANYSSAVDPWTHPGGVNWALSGATITGTVTGGSIVYERDVTPVYGQNTSNPIATSIAAGAELRSNGTLAFVPDDETAFTSFAKEPNASGGSFTQTVQFTKNSAAQFMSLVFPSSYFKDAEQFFRFDQGNPKVWEREFNWSCAGTITADVKTP